MELISDLRVGIVANVYLCVPIVQLQDDFWGDEYSCEQNEVLFESFTTPNEAEAEQEEEPNMHDIDLEFEVVDTKFEESYNDASYMTRSANDPTKNGQGFHQDI